MSLKQRPVTEFRLWNVRQTARYLGLSYNSTLRLDPHELPFYRVTTRGDRRYDPIEVDLYLLRRRVEA